ncbi:hypothetical protein [Micromonospora sp. SL4-19]|uniref:hypothetical protein n=1 Tax=Micromonospora sp. SL4-19 TaxID=3399129 RepID=UPI003A4D4332
MAYAGVAGGLIAEPSRNTSTAVLPLLCWAAALAVVAGWSIWAAAIGTNLRRPPASWTPVYRLR